MSPDSAPEPAPATPGSPAAAPQTVPAPDPAVVNSRIASAIATELGVGAGQVRSAIELLDGGSTVPFVARYRKEATGGLDDAQLRTLDERLGYLRDLEARRQAVRESIAAQGKLDAALDARILEADTKARLEDIYLPYKPKRRTKAQIAREAGHEPVADALLSDPTTDPATFTAEQLDGARAIAVERFAEDADLVGELRELMWQTGVLRTTVRDGKESAGAKFADYFEFSEPFTSLPSHRVLAVLRGEREEILSVTLDADPAAADRPAGPGPYEQRIAARFGIADQGRPADRWLTDTVRWAWRTKLFVGLSLDVRMRLRQAAEADAVAVFATNLKDLLLAAPAGSRTTMGLDPGLRTGVKVAVVNATGRVVDHATIYPHEPRRDKSGSLAVLGALVEKHGVELIAIGNGTASRETDALAGELLSAIKEAGKKPPTSVVVSEAGASVYSASAYASKELPDLDVSIRGAVSIARRLQDPLAELVKIDPKSIGVGQYQHDISETLLARSLGAVVEDAVNAVGVDVNTASVPLLSRVSGITAGLAESIVAHRDTNGAFRDRKQITAVPRLGPKAFEQCAGFLRIADGDNPLDASSVHPEAYPVVTRILEKVGTDVRSLIGDTATLTKLRPEEFVDETFGRPTVVDIIAELDKPGRDPRPEFKTATFAMGIEKVSDLTPGMVLEGQVTNVAAFGAFVDVGVHQDGLVHVSAMAHRFVSDPHEVVKSGDIVKVKVMDVDIDRKRIGLSLRLDDEPGSDGKPSRAPRGQGREDSARGGGNQPRRNEQRGGGRGNPGGQGRGAQGQGNRGGNRNDRRPAPSGAMADALKRAGFGK
ncbi:S1 RNA-binding domain-containing protein [Gordonia sp. JH63]|uniref:Tex family protein n=1 Tax=Gordonia TaxID=2053 RepID=UPI00131F9F40|nr:MULTISPECIES: Tex family protein [Gordonia]MBN0974729.1 RNA-binding transcriptional accessory protein [Gordonia sp. BP-119]MBN0984765.1 RNA-binding transcriptional accessory protein [Gordonia sp. BP-94]QHD88201.1 S1 RNA-binding domain-containing protein [Gordonia sp. JH63]